MTELQKIRNIRKRFSQKFHKKIPPDLLIIWNLIIFAIDKQC